MNTTDQQEEDYGDVNNDIAIIGMAGRFPMAENVDQFWANLVSSRDCITRFSAEDLEKFGIAPEALENPNFIPAAGFIPDQDKFDAHFFEMNPRDAANLDPQHRFGLEVAWQTLEHAGYTAASVNGSVGVFAGVNMSTYLIFNLMQSEAIEESSDGLSTLIGVDKDMFATRISYKLNLNGPSVALGTACSTSLVCIHLACQSLLNGESKMALAGGAHIATPNTVGHFYQEGGYTSRDEMCRSFDAQGSGTVAGAGTCFVLLKRMEDALEDNDTIYAVIKGSAVNNDGSEKIGYTAPSIVGQTKIIAEAQAVAGVEPESIRFIEAHGTATPLGDPIEFAALTRAFRLQTDKKNFCGIGSVKSNVGHMGVAAGAASIVKAALSLKNKVIPESLHFESPNPKLDIENSPFYVVDKLERIAPGKYPARAGVSSLGIGGTNAHIILEEPPVVESSESRAWQLVVLSAKTPSALDNMSKNLSDYMKNAADDVIGDVAFTLQVGRVPFAFRRSFVVPANNLVRIAESIAPGKGYSAKVPEKDKKVVFMFSGGGTQYVNMARDLYESEPAFAVTMDACAALFKRKMNMDIIDLIYPEDDQVEANAVTLQRPKNFFAALFMVEYSLAKLWMSWGVKPEALIGHSMGEYVAACIAGVFTLEDAVNLICCRGALFEKLEKGAMLSVTAPAPQVQQLLIDGVSMATVNDPGRCSVAGRPEPIAAFEKILQAQGIEYRKLLIDAAGHSPMIDPILEEFGKFLATVKFSKPNLPIISNLSGTWVDANEICTPDYWKKHLRQTVRFSDGVATLLKDPNSIFLEIGPGNALCSFVRTQVTPGSESLLLNSVRHVNEEKDDMCHLLETTGKLWAAGVTIDWKAFYAEEQRKRIALPSYPFDRKRYWVEPMKQGRDPGGKLEVADWFWQPGWRLEERKAAAFAGHDVVLVFVDAQQAAAGVMQQLREQGARVIAVSQGAGYVEIDAQHFQINAANDKEYLLLMAKLLQLNALPKTILHCWSLSDTSDQQQQLVNSQLSLVYLAKALSANNVTESLSIVGVTNRREAVLSDDTINCMQALITGPEKVIPYEFPNIRFITLDVSTDGTGQVDLTPFLLNELEIVAEQTSSHTAIALRNGLRFVKDFVPLATADNAGEKANIKEHGVYIVTGGLGGVGMVHAQALAACKTRLVLLQRSRFPEASDWDALLADPTAGALVKEQIKGVKNLQSLGAEILIVQADVADSEQVAEAVAAIKAKFGVINGLVHCAGYGEFVEIKLTSKEIIEAVLSPKITGTNNLLAALTNENLELVILCSSMSAQTTGYGLVGYVSACAYLDTLAHAHRGDAKTRFLSINWDVWNTPQQTIRLQGDAEPSHKQPGNPNAISPREGIDVIYRALAAGKPQAVISTLDFQKLLRKNQKMSDVLLSGGDDEEVQSEVKNTGLSLYDRPNLSTEYVAPSTKDEILLASIWQETLGINTIGINDNFFELGGESLLGVRIAVKAKKLGLFFGPKQMFSTPTIAQIVQSLSASSAIAVDQSAVSGETAASPVQQQFLRTEWVNKNHWNIGSLLSMPQAMDEDKLKSVASALIAQHDVLHTRFSCNAAGSWRQVYDPLNVDSHVAYIDLSSSSAAEFSAQLQLHGARLQASFDVEQGPIFKLVYFKAATPALSLVGVLVHHIVADAVSLGIILEDLTTLLGSSGALPLKTSSYKDFSDALQAKVNAEAFQGDIDYWQNFADDCAANINAVPVDISDAKNSEKDTDALTMTLSAEQTQLFLQNTARESQLKVNELLVAVLAKTLSDWQQQATVLIDVVHNGRPDLEAIDLSRTAGWFGVGGVMPLTLSNAPLAMQMSALRSQLDAVPQQGLSLAWIQSLHASEALRTSLSSLPSAAVSLNYLGQADQLLSGGADVSTAEAFNNLRDPDNQRTYQHDIVAFIQNGQLTLIWSFGKTQYHAATIQGLLDNMAQHLQQLITTDWSNVLASCARRDISDATLAQHGIAPDQIEDYYPLSPFQSEMYRLYCDESRPLSNVAQALALVDGPTNNEMFTAVWQAIIARHKILRTRFMKDVNGVPVQVVCKQADVRVIEVDLAHVPEADQEQALQQLMFQDRQTRYKLSEAPALRFYFVSLNPALEKSALLSSNHQIILDGWTTSLLSADLMTCGMAIATGSAIPALNLANDFSDYIGWMTKQNNKPGKAYWKQAFSGYQQRDPLQSILSAAPLIATGADSYGELELIIADSLLDNIQECARVTQTTGNAVFQAAWALALAQVRGDKDIVYGVTVSGRSCDLDGITEIVGQCSSTLPVRIPIADNATVTQLLQVVHDANTHAQTHNILSLSEISTLLGLDSNARLYSSNFIFENIPRTAGSEASANKNSFWVDGWQFPLRVFVVPEDKTWVRFAYDKSKLTQSDVSKLADNYLKNLETIVASVAAPVSLMLRN